MIPNPDNPILITRLSDKIIGERRRLDWHQVYLIIEGEGGCEIDYEHEPISNLQVVNIPKGAILKEEFHHCQGFALSFLEEFYTEVQRELLDAYVAYAILNRKLRIDVPENKLGLLKGYIHLIEHEMEHQDDPNRVFILQNLMLALFNRLEGMVLEFGSPFITHRSVFQQFIQLLNKHYINEKAVGFYTEALNITSKNLNKVLKETVGKSAQELIAEKTLLEAKRLLCFTSNSIKEISFHLGYESPYYFSRFFKSKFDQSPEEFRLSFSV